jgi:hypothetical protein
VRERRSRSRRLDRVDQLGDPVTRCKCGLPPDVAAKPWTQSIVMRHPGDDDSDVCPDCGGRRKVVLMDAGFPL